MVQQLEQAKLDVSHKTRANLFNWRGQFTPELIEHLLDCYPFSVGAVHSGRNSVPRFVFDTRHPNPDTLFLEKYGYAPARAAE